MQTSKRTVKFERHEWTLSSPAHYTDVEKAVAVAADEVRSLNSREPHRAGDVQVSARDDVVVVWFEAEQPKVATRGDKAEATR